MGSIPGVASTSIEVATLLKLQKRLLPFLLALYVIAFIDRTNLGFAALTMNRELAITSEQFGLAAGIFFWGSRFIVSAAKPKLVLSMKAMT
jgi:MFS transporter, ACS family, tartrate transporter